MAVVDLYGLGVRSRVETLGTRADELTDAVRRAWSRCLTPGGGEAEGGRFTLELSEGGDVGSPRDAAPGKLTALASADPDALLQSLTQAVTAASIQARTGELLMFHAGAVAEVRSGAALGFVAPGGTGKTTLARRLGASLGYLTDETVGVDADGLVVPYPKPLSLRPAEFTGTKHETSPDELGLRRPPARARLARIVLLRREEARSEPTFEELSVVDAIVALAPETSALSALERPLHRLAALLDSLPPVLEVRYAEADTVTDPLAALLGGSR